MYVFISYSSASLLRKGIRTRTSRQPRRSEIRNEPGLFRRIISGRGMLTEPWTVVASIASQFPSGISLHEFDRLWSIRDPASKPMRIFALKPGNEGEHEIGRASCRERV